MHSLLTKARRDFYMIHWPMQIPISHKVNVDDILQNQIHNIIIVVKVSQLIEHYQLIT